jgi:anti-sigma factor ChrR (cupin superfamily)
MRGWRERSLEPQESLAVSDHLEECAACGRAITDDASAVTIAADLRAQLEQASAELLVDHPTHEELSDWIDGRAGEAGSGRIGAHLEVCRSCREEAEDLRAFAGSLAQERGAGVGWRMAAAALAAALVLAIGAAILLRRGEAPQRELVASSPTSAPAQSPAPPALVLHDGSGEVRVEADGTLHGVPEPWRVAIAALLRDPEPALPAIALALARVPDPERGGETSQRARAVRLLAPVSAVTLDDRPTFRWTGPAGTVVRVEVFDRRFSTVASSPEVRESEWRSAARLPRGEELTWTLVVSGPDAVAGTYPRRPDPPAAFRVLPEAEAQRVEAATASGSHLVAGLALWQAGLVDEAAREWEELARQNPGSPVARRLADGSTRSIATLPGRSKP